MQIAGVASAFPEHYYPQEELVAELQKYWGDRIENPDVLRRLHRHTGVAGRYLSIPKSEYLTMKSWGEANRHWIRTATELGEKAVANAATSAGLRPQDLGAFFFTSVTGICSPSIDALLVNKMGLNRNIRRVPIFGLGCVAGAAGISRAAGLCESQSGTSRRCCSLWSYARSPFSATISRWPTSYRPDCLAMAAAAVIVTSAESGLAGPTIARHAFGLLSWIRKR